MGRGKFSNSNYVKHSGKISVRKPRFREAHRLTRGNLRTSRGDAGKEWESMLHQTQPKKVRNLREITSNIRITDTCKEDYSMWLQGEKLDPMCRSYKEADWDG